MVRVLKLAVCFAASAFWLHASAATAAEVCPEGKTASGECVNAGLAFRMRQNGLSFAQPKISSFTSQAIMPEEDYRYRYPHELTNTPSQTPRQGIPGGAPGTGGGGVPVIIN